MADFWHAVAAYPLARNALLAALLVSVACGVVGSYVVVRRITYIAAGVAHCVLGGLGAARYLSVTRGWDWLRPEYGALAAALRRAGRPATVFVADVDALAAVVLAPARDGDVVITMGAGSIRGVPRQWVPTAGVACWARTCTCSRRRRPARGARVTC